MKLLALDTATEACSAALSIDGEVNETYEVIGRGHADRLLPMVDELLRKAGIAMTALDAIAFGCGPGGFTGLRIAAGTAQGLAAGIGRPVLPVSDLAALAAAGARHAGTERVLACLDARMGQVYWAAFDCSGGVPLALTDERLADPADVMPPTRAPWFGAGHGFGAYPAMTERLRGQLSGTAAELLPRAADVARIAALEFAAGRGLEAARALPVYLRNEVVHRR
jgi:tRNA threonylcarbamoyladenosine biosynthesis protein TsaB